MQRNIKLVALDLDGTLLDSSKSLSDANRSALELAAARGVAVVPATGRFFDAIPECVRELPFVDFAITINGAQVFDRRTRRSVFRAEIPQAVALGVMSLLDSFDVIYDCYRDGRGWMTRALQEKAALYAPDVHYERMIRELRTPVPDLKEHVRASGTDVQKVMFFARDEAVRAAARNAISERFPELLLTSSTPNNLEINAPEANKGNALRGLCAHLGLDADANSMSFGDAPNDLSMIQAAGIGVAMANSAPEVLAAADWVTLSNDDDGVAAALRHFGVI